MSANQFPKLDPVSIESTRDALHSYAGILGNWLKTCRPKRKHWWHASLRPSLNGLTTGVVHADLDFEMELDFSRSSLNVRTAYGGQLTEALHGQTALQLATQVRDFLISSGVDEQFVPNAAAYSDAEFPGYSATHAIDLGRALNAVSAALQLFRAGIKQETSPIQLWPHHFDLSMLWLPGGKIPGQDPEDEEYSDQQMNFGFTFGDAGIPEPYFYITAYPLPDGLPEVILPKGTVWQSEGFNGAVLRYRELLLNNAPDAYLLGLWNQLLSAGRKHMPELAA